MPITILYNVYTPLGLVNGARGTAAGIVPHPDDKLKLLFAHLELQSRFLLSCSAPTPRVRTVPTGTQSITKHSVGNTSPDESCLRVARVQSPRVDVCTGTPWTYGTGEDAAHSRHPLGYVQLSRLQMMDNLWLLEPITLDDLRNKMLHRELVAEDSSWQPRPCS